MPAKGATRAQKKRNREAADWILRNGDPNQSEADKARFREWLELDPENRQTYKVAERLMGDVSRAVKSDSTLASITVKPQNTARRATAAVLLAALATGAFFAFDGPVRLQADMIAGTDEMPVFTLEDGSEVQLNASSAIAVDFSGTRRTIRLLRGQAFFQVAHAPERPFTVLAGDASVTALGTAFDVRYGNAGTEVTVTENAVQIEFDGPGTKPVRVGRGEQAVLDYERQEAAVSPADGLSVLAWRRGQIAVENAPLSYVVEEMSRHFYGQIVIASPALASRRVSGTINVANIDDALGFVTEVLGVKATRLGPVIIIRQ